MLPSMTYTPPKKQTHPPRLQLHKSSQCCFLPSPKRQDIQIPAYPCPLLWWYSGPNQRIQSLLMSTCSDNDTSYLWTGSSHSPQSCKGAWHHVQHKHHPSQHFCCIMFSFWSHVSHKDPLVAPSYCSPDNYTSCTGHAHDTGGPHLSLLFLSIQVESTKFLTLSHPRLPVSPPQIVERPLWLPLPLPLALPLLPRPYQ